MPVRKIIFRIAKRPTNSNSITHTITIKPSEPIAVEISERRPFSKLNFVDCWQRDR